MGILKKTGSWKTNKHTKRVSFGFEYYSTGEKKRYAKFCDGISDPSFAWLQFMEDIFIDKIHPMIVWQRVPGMYTDYIWNMVLDVLDRYYLTGRFMAMPQGCRDVHYSINGKNHREVQRLETWVNFNIIRYGYENLEKTSTYVYKKKYDSDENDVNDDENDVNDDENDYNDDENDENNWNDWDYLKQNCCSKPFQDIIYLVTPHGNVEI
jgi:hypothetical protein